MTHAVSKVEESICAMRKYAGIERMQRWVMVQAAVEQLFEAAKLPLSSSIRSLRVQGFVACRLIYISVHEEALCCSLSRTRRIRQGQAVLGCKRKYATRGFGASGTSALSSATQAIDVLLSSVDSVDSSRSSID